MVETSMAVAGSFRPVSKAEQAIDLAHLARMTFYDRSLEREVLQLFSRQSEILIERMHRLTPAAVSALAHTLKGSAQGIGAKNVARAAERVEDAANKDAEQLRHAVEALQVAAADARAMIADFLRTD